MQCSMICLHARRKSLKIGYRTSLPFTENPHIERKQESGGSLERPFMV